MRRVWIGLSILAGLLLLHSLFIVKDQFVAISSGLLFAISFGLILKNRDVKVGEGVK